VGLRIWIWINQVEGLAYYNLYTFTRVDGICIGCMVAILQKINFQFLNRNTSIIVFSFAGLNFLFYYINRQNEGSFPYLAMIGYTTFAMIFGLLIHDIVNHRTVLFNKLFNVSILKFFGKVSYGCYIIHWPLYLMIGPSLREWSQAYFPFIPAAFFASTVATILAYFAGYLSFRFFEMKFLTLKKYFV
jgi:peptidoglycan/LPS O-acetylase OafA/YrhL